MKPLFQTKREPLAKMLPNIVTIFGIFVGLTAVRSALQGEVASALYLLVFAMLLDGIDGRLARTLNCESKIGAELDTLADFFNFGIATPLVVFYTIFNGSDVAQLAWVSVMLFSASCALRLARFNVSQTEASQNDFFIGVPAPLLGCLGLTPLFLVMVGVDVANKYEVSASIFLIVCAALAVGPFPTVSMKGTSFPSSMRVPLTLLALLMTIAFIQFPWHTLLFFNTIYLGTIPVYAFLQRTKIKKD